LSPDIPMKVRVLARSLVHATLGISMAVALQLSPKVYVIAASAVLTGLFLLAEFVSFVLPSCRRWLCRQFSLLMRPEEERKVTGATYFLIGATATLLFFPADVAAMAVLFLALGDPTASAVGRWLGPTRVRTKNVEGHLACLTVCLLLTAILAVWSIPPGFAVGALGALAATLAQALPWRVNDNLTIPIGSAAVMTLAARAFGVA
jgi:dolichol kinase